MIESKEIKAKTIEAFENIKSNLNYTRDWGIAIGVIAITFYSYNIGGIKLASILLIVSAASYMCGFFLGFLFGIPKRVNGNNTDGYLLNTNLVEISDWLTKIIIGVGLIEIKEIPIYLQSMGNFVQNATKIKDENSIHLFAISTILYFSVFGLYYGYNYMRLFLSGQFKDADDNLLKDKQEQLIKKGEALQKQDITPDNIGEKSKELSEYNAQLKDTKTETEYTFEDWYLKGLSAYDKNESEKTIVFMKNAIEKDPKAKDAPTAFIYIAISYGHLKLYETGIKFCDRVLHDYPKYDSMYLPYYNKAVFLGDLKRYEEALSSYDKSIVLNRQYPNSYNGKGWILSELNRHEEAISMYEKAIELNINFADAIFNKAFSLEKIGRYEEALKEYEKTIEIQPEVSVYNSKARLLLLLNKYSEAIQIAELAINLDPNFAPAWYNKACCFSKLNNTEQMLNSLEKAIALNSSNRIFSKNDAYFKDYWSNPAFIKLVE